MRILANEYPTRVVDTELAFDPAIAELTSAMISTMKPSPQTTLAIPVQGSEALKSMNVVIFDGPKNTVAA